MRVLYCHYIDKIILFQANEETKDLEKYYIQDAIGSTLFSKSWLLSTLSNLNTENSESISKEEEDLESISGWGFFYKIDWLKVNKSQKNFILTSN